MLELLIILLISIAVSTLGTLAGFGGAVFLVPILILFFDYPIEIAVGSVIVALVPSSMLTSFFNFRNKTIDFKVGALLEIPTVVGTLLGAVLISIIPVFPLEILFSVFLLGIGFFMLKSNNPETTSDKNSLLRRINKLPPSFIVKNRHFYAAYQISLWMLGFFGLATGIMAGLFGVGGGFMKTPIMIKLFKIPHKIATSTAMFMIVITSLTGSISHYFLGHIQWEKSLPIISGFLVGAIIGRFFNKKLTSVKLERIIALTLLLAGIAVGANAFLN